MSVEIGLRERKKQRTRELISDTARKLFAERGFERVSVAEIARAAEVSGATVFNYFPTKEDLVFSGFEAFEERLLAAVRDRPTGQSVAEAFGEFILESRGFLNEPDQQRAAELVGVTRMIAASPSLLARQQQVLARYTESLAELIAAETSARPGDLRPHAAANALIGVHDALISYVRKRVADGTPDRRRLAREVRTRGDQALGLLGEGLDTYARKS
jgi:AcrR family transcriptional regulator